MAICFVIFNPARTRRMLMNYFYVLNEMQKNDLPVYTIELVYEGRKPEIANSIRVFGKSYMFHKENLYRILESKIPRKYKKLAFLDADILFDDENWYERTSELLDSHDVVQPFENAHWLNLEYKAATLTRPSIVKMPGSEVNARAYHPGFAWCMRRDFYKRVGFFDLAVSGSGDTLSSAAWLNKTLSPTSRSVPSALQKDYAAFRKLSKPRMTYLSGCDVYHLFHGSRGKRQYQERHAMLDAGSIRSLLTQNANGVYEWKDASFNDKFLAYFVGRDDDGFDEPDVTFTS